MAVVTKGNEEQDDREAEDRDELAERDQHDDRDDDDRDDRAAAPETKPPVLGYRAPAPSGIGGGWFHIYKPGQGYWTRMGTVAGCGLLLALVAHFLYQEFARNDVRESITFGVIGGVVLISAVLLWRLLNKPTVVDFMVATESEMKKVNWTSRKELIGSTKVVIFFMFLISAILFVIDIIFGYLFYFISVLKKPPI